jgi:CRP-like cAMP-binding protein
VLLQEGQQGRWAYLVLSGAAVRHEVGGGPTVVEPGEFIGGLEVLAGSSITARVTAGSELTVLALGAREFRGALDTVPCLADAVLKVAARKALEADRHRRERARRHPVGHPDRRRRALERVEVALPLAAPSRNTGHIAPAGGRP